MTRRCQFLIFCGQERDEAKAEINRLEAQLRRQLKASTSSTGPGDSEAVKLREELSRADRKVLESYSCVMAFGLNLNRRFMT